jgi:hypothetical protein
MNGLRPFLRQLRNRIATWPSESVHLPRRLLWFPNLGAPARERLVDLVSTGEWVVERGQSRLMNNYLSRNLLREEGTALGTVGSVLLGAKNFYTAIELGFAGFHGAFVTAVLAKKVVASEKGAPAEFEGSGARWAPEMWVAPPEWIASASSFQLSAISQTSTAAVRRERNWACADIPYLS